MAKVDKSTFKCPECGTKVLNATGYCLKCKKKVKPKGSQKESRLSLEIDALIERQPERFGSVSEAGPLATQFASLRSEEDLLETVKDLERMSGQTADDILEGRDESSARVWRRIQGILGEAALKIQDVIR